MSTTRRTIITGAAAAIPAAVAAVPALASLAAEDPVFAAIDEFCRLRTDLLAKFYRATDEKGPDYEAACDNFLEGIDDAQWRLLETTPTTPGGIAKLARISAELDTDGEEWPEDWRLKLIAVIAKAAEAIQQSAHAGAAS